MAATVNTYKVHFHMESGGKRVSETYVHYVQAAGPDFNSISSVLSANGKIRGGNTLMIESVQELGHGEVTLA